MTKVTSQALQQGRKRTAENASLQMTAENSLEQCTRDVIW